MRKLLLVLGLGLVLSSCEKDLLVALDGGHGEESTTNSNRFTYNDKKISDCNIIQITKYDSLSSLGDGVLSNGKDTSIVVVMTLQYEAQIQIAFSNYKGSGHYSLFDGEVLFNVGNEGTMIDGVVNYDKIAGYVDITEELNNSFKGEGRIKSHGYDVYFSFNSDLIDKFYYHNNYIEL